MLTCQYMPDVYGGAEKQCRRLAKFLAAKGVGVQIVTSTQSRSLPVWRDPVWRDPVWRDPVWRDSVERDPVLRDPVLRDPVLRDPVLRDPVLRDPVERDEGVAVKRIYSRIAPDLLGRWSYYSLVWTFQVVLWVVVRRQSIDIIHCHQGKYGAFVGCLLGALLNKPVIIKIGNSNEDLDFLCLRRKRVLGPLCYKFILARQPHIVAITSVIEAHLRQLGFRNVRKIPNGVDVQLRCNPVVNSSSGYVEFFYHGRIEPIKRVDLLLKAFARLPGAQQRLHIFGDGSSLPQLKQLREDLGLERSVVFHGAVSDVIERIAAMDIFVNASKAEGFSNSLLESLLLGKVLVSTDVSGACDAINDGVNGVIATSDTPDCIAQAMSSALVIFRSNLKSAKAVSAEKVRSEFDMKIVAEQYVDLYGGL